MREVEIAVVGAGAMGAAAAWRLARAGREVTLLERFEIGHARGSSHGPARIFRLAYEDPLYVRMAQRALPLWRELEAESGRALLETTGGIDAGDPASLARIEDALASCGAPVERIERPSERFAGIRLDGPAVFSPDTGVLAASGAVEAMVDLARTAGAQVRSGCEALLVGASERSVTLDAGGETLRARSCVLAPGAWMRAMLAPLGADPPLTVSREQVCYFPQRADFPVLIDRGETLRFAMPSRFGAPGARAGEHGTGERTTAEARTFDPDEHARARVEAWVERALPGAEPRAGAVETCLYTSTPDEDFVIDRLGALVVASPCSGHGFKFAPLVGEICAALATGREPPVDCSRFSLRRFALPLG